MSEICAAEMRQVEYFNAVSFQVRTIVNCDMLVEVLLHFFTQHVSGEVALRDTTKRTDGWVHYTTSHPVCVCVCTLFSHTHKLHQLHTTRATYF